jgi:hypothetical protein
MVRITRLRDDLRNRQWIGRHVRTLPTPPSLSFAIHIHSSQCPIAVVLILIPTSAPMNLLTHIRSAGFTTYTENPSTPSASPVSTATCAMLSEEAGRKRLMVLLVEVVWRD